jgi:hypothetical protein
LAGRRDRTPHDIAAPIRLLRADSTMIAAQMLVVGLLAVAAK